MDPISNTNPPALHIIAISTPLFTPPELALLLGFVAASDPVLIAAQKPSVQVSLPLQSLVVEHGVFTAAVGAVVAFVDRVGVTEGVGDTVATGRVAIGIVFESVGWVVVVTVEGAIVVGVAVGATVIVEFATAVGAAVVATAVGAAVVTIAVGATVVTAAVGLAVKGAVGLAVTTAAVVGATVAGANVVGAAVATGSAVSAAACSCRRKFVLLVLPSLTPPVASPSPSTVTAVLIELTKHTKVPKPNIILLFIYNLITLQAELI